MKYYLEIKRNEVSTHACCDMDDPWKRYAQWKKPITKGSILYHSICTKCPEYANLHRHEVGSFINLLKGWGEKGRAEDWLLTDMRLFLGRSKNVLKLDHDDGCTACEHAKNHWLLHFKCVNCILCELSQQKSLLDCSFHLFHFWSIQLITTS